MSSGIRINVRHNVARSRRIRRAREMAPYRNAMYRIVQEAIRDGWAERPIETFPPYIYGIDLGSVLLFGTTAAGHLAIVDNSRTP